MKIRQLSHLKVLAEIGHFGRAAQALNITQPALSRSIQALETALDLPIIDRSQKRVALTPHGELVLARARDILIAEQRLKRDVALFKGEDIGDIVVGASAIPAAVLLTPALCRCLDSHPRLHAELVVGNWREMLRAVQNSEVDLAIVDISGLGEEQGVDIHPLPPNRVGFVARQDHPLAGQELELAELAGFALAVPRAMKEGLFEQLFAGRGYQGSGLKISLRYEMFNVIKPAMLGSNMIALVPEMVLGQASLGGRLAMLKVTDMPEMEARFGIIVRSGAMMAPATRLLCQAIQALARELAA
ncbi:LysR family transcriptional regulator [Gallaecimonas sp. GXIMD4217]|uniref:LysR family transcriptional regulator n=1 Tax=Gallaecimonas sp. GXIMD4217 TaxID=3131927 RepID=UPI00311AD581